MTEAAGEASGSIAADNAMATAKKQWEITLSTT